MGFGSLWKRQTEVFLYRFICFFFHNVCKTCGKLKKFLENGVENFYSMIRFSSSLIAISIAGFV